MRRSRRVQHALVVLAVFRILGCGGHVETSHGRPALAQNATGGAGQSAPLFGATDASVPGAFPGCSGEFCSSPGGAPGSGVWFNGGAGGAGIVGGSTAAGGTTAAGGALGTGGIGVDAGQSGVPPAITYRMGKGTVDVFTVVTGIEDPLSDLTTDADGNVWFVSTVHVGRLTPLGGVTLFPVQDEAIPGYPWTIVTGSDGNPWFGRLNGGDLTRVTTEGVMTAFPMPAADWFDAPMLVAGPDALWFGGQQFGFIGEMSPAGVVSKIPVATADGIGLAVGADGTLWFDSTFLTDGGLTPSYRITRRASGGASENYPVPGVLGPMIADRDGSLWFSEIDPGKLARLTPGGRLQEVDVQRGADPNSLSFGINDITTDGAGNPWFVEPEASALATIDVASNVMTEFSVVDPVCGTCVLPTQLAVAPSGVVWFVRGVENAPDGARTTIGRLTVGG